MAIDLFAGAGGATQGLVDAGFQVVGAVENDADAAQSYRLNHPGVLLWETDIRKVPASKARRALGLEPGRLALLKACPPCQGFSSLAEGRAAVDETRNDLVGVTIRFVREFRPQAVLLENVPGLGRDARSAKLQADLAGLGYSSRAYLVDAQQFGVPQRRKRLIIIGLRGKRSDSKLPREITDAGLDGPLPPKTVRTALRELNDVLDPGDPLNVFRVLSPLVKRRVAAIPVGGSRFDLPEELQLACHKKADAGSRGATASYGRIKLDDVSPTMTTRCTTPACGTFIHPVLDRGLTLREAAILQTFPVGYKFSGRYGSIERQIGNAVPVKMAEELGSAVRRLIAASGSARLSRLP